jgi:FixJ family two-component response regulator
MTAPVHTAFVIELDLNLADALGEVLSSWGYQARTFSCHRQAAMAAEAFVRIDLLAACVPSADDDLQGAYLAAAAGRQGEPMAVVLMVSDAFAIEGAPAGAVRLEKPSTCAELARALRAAGCAANPRRAL